MNDDDDGDCDGNHYDGCVVDGMVTMMMMMMMMMIMTMMVIVRNDDDDDEYGNYHNPDNNHITLAAVIFSRPSAGARC